MQPFLFALQMRLLVVFSAFFLLTSQVFSQLPEPPAAATGFGKVTSYDEVVAYLQHLDRQSDLVAIDSIGISANGRFLYALKFSSGEFGTTPEKVRVLIFAQQHGNEQSGKEGALLLAYFLTKPENRHLFGRLDLALVPQVNPDGSEINARRNAHLADLNRNHLILTEPETQALHRLFDRYLFEASLDVHEYYPYGDDWKESGYRKNSEVTLGTATNPNVAGSIRDFSLNSYLPFFRDYLTGKGFSAFEYCPGGPPGSTYIRRSTFDVNDGRQSLAIQQTFAFIQEGMNGTDSYIENLERRAEGQCAGMMAFLEFIYENDRRIKDLVISARDSLMNCKSDSRVPVQMEHTGNGTALELPLYSYASGSDTLVTVSDYKPVVQSLFQVTRPAGYLLPAADRELLAWAGRHSLNLQRYGRNKEYRIEEYLIGKIGTIDFEGDTIVDPEVTCREYQGRIGRNDFLFLPVDQLKGTLIIYALEPKSMLGLVTYSGYSHLLKAGEPFPVLRVVKKEAKK